MTAASPAQRQTVKRNCGGQPIYYGFSQTGFRAVRTHNRSWPTCDSKRKKYRQFATDVPLLRRGSPRGPGGCSVRANAITLAITIGALDCVLWLLLPVGAQSADVFGDRPFLADIGRPVVDERGEFHAD